MPLTADSQDKEHSTGSQHCRRGASYPLLLQLPSFFAHARGTLTLSKETLNRAENALAYANFVSKT